MRDPLRQEIAATAQLVVVKVGTRVLTDAAGLLDRARIDSLAEELHQIMAGGRRVVLVSSGAVGAGMGKLGLRQRPTNLAQLQAVAAVGQSSLVEAYDRALSCHGRHAAQLLLTAEDLDDRTRYLNVRNTLHALMELGALPIINENDTVAVDELLTTFGDNDRLAAMVTNILRASLLVILSDVDGLYDGPPDDKTSKVIPTVTRIDESIQSLVRDTTGGLSKGGMASKLNAAHIATAAGENVIVAGGREPGNLSRILEGDEVGTLFVAQGPSVSSRKRWIGFAIQPRGRLIVDLGARRAVESQGKSLLAAGIVDCIGEFDKGDAVTLCDTEGHEFARGLSNYTATEIQKIKGLKTDAIAATLSHCPYDEVVHRDNMTVTENGS